MVVVNWKPNFEDQWAVVLFDEGEQAILEAFTHVSEELVVPEFRWAYQPRKRDGRNEERKARFVEALGETTIRLPVPVSAEQLTGFIDAATRIADTRRHAESLPKLADVGSWIYQANPDYYNGDGALRLHDGPLKWSLNRHGASSYVTPSSASVFAPARSVSAPKSSAIAMPRTFGPTRARSGSDH